VEIEREAVVDRLEPRRRSPRTASSIRHGGARRGRREQADRRGTGVCAGAAGIVSAKPQAGRSTTPAAATWSIALLVVILALI